MSFVLFKAGDYGNKGNWSKDKLANLIQDKELDVIPYHTSEFTKLGMLRNEIPVIGKFKNISIKGDEIIAGDVEIFDRKEFKNRKVDRLSVEIENGKITRVGALPVGVEPAVSNSGSFANGEFSQGFEMDWINQENIIEFSDETNKKEGSDNMNLDELLEKLKDTSGNEKIKIMNELFKTLSEDEITKVEIPKRKEPGKTEEEIREEVKKEFAREQEIKEFMAKNDSKITPAMKKLGIEEFVKQAFSNNDGIVEFSENGASQKAKTSDVLNKIFENLPSYGGNNPLEFGDDDKERTERQKEIQKEIEAYKQRNNLK